MEKVIKIDFNNRSNSTINLFEDSIRFKEQKFFLGLLKKWPDFNYHKLSVEIVECSSSIKLNKKNGSLIKIKRRNETNKNKIEYEIQNTHRDFPVKNYEVPYQVLLDTSAISDYNDYSDNEKTIKLRILRQGIPAISPNQKDLDFTIQFHQAFPEPQTSFQLDEKYLTGIEHCRNVIMIGTLNIESKSAYRYSHFLNCEVTANLHKENFEKIIKFDNNISESNPQYDTREGLRSEDEIPVSILETKSFDNSLTINNLVANNKVRVPLFIDLRELPNPIEKEELNLTFTISYDINNNKRFDSFSETIKILQDTRTTALMCLVRKGIGNDFIDHSQIENERHKFQWVPPSVKSNQGAVICFTFRIGNFAENNSDDEDGAIWIDEVEYSFFNDDGSPSELITKENYNDPAKIFLIKNLDDEDGNCKAYPNEPNSYFEHEISFRHDSIKDIPEDRYFGKMEISFNYVKTKDWIKDSDLNDEAFTEFFNKNKRIFSKVIFFEIEKNPGPYWLGIDLGTSAVVSAYSKGDFEKENLIDLQESLKTILEKAHGSITERYTKVNTAEFGTEYLSSTIYLREGGYLNTKNIKQNLLHISPLRSDVTNPAFLVPYLKSMIGSEYIPNFNNKYDNLTYFDASNNETDFRDTPLKTIDVLHGIYTILINDFITPRVVSEGLEEKLNKLVLSIPNLFTPRHTDLIRDLVSNQFPHFKKNYLTFISESDAIASYYLKQWNELNRNRPLENLNKLRSNKEYALVYDMGAGTLDLTYFEIQYSTIEEAEQDIKKVNIIGKIGSPLAGNYFDYVLAKELYSQFKTEFKEDIFKSEDITPDKRRNRRELKLFVRNELKPLLYSAKKDVKLSLPGLLKNDITINIAELQESEGVTQFIKENTSILFSNFFRLFQKEKIEKGDLKLDTVIFTGRGVQLKKLKREIEITINQWTGQRNTHFIGLDEEKLKSSVVNGALMFALLYNKPGSRVKIMNKNLQAKYGVLYIDPMTEHWNFKELLNPFTKPIHNEPSIVDGMYIYEYDTDIYSAEEGKGTGSRKSTVDLSASGQAYIIQSFSMDPARDKEEGRDYLNTKIVEINTGLFSSLEDARNVHIRIQINKKNEMIIEYGSFRNDPKDPLLINIMEDQSFIKSMWPFLD